MPYQLPKMATDCHLHTCPRHLRLGRRRRDRDIMYRVAGRKPPTRASAMATQGKNVSPIPEHAASTWTPQGDSRNPGDHGRFPSNPPLATQASPRNRWSRHSAYPIPPPACPEKRTALASLHIHNHRPRASSLPQHPTSATATYRPPPPPPHTSYAKRSPSGAIRAPQMHRCHRPRTQARHQPGSNASARQRSSSPFPGAALPTMLGRCTTRRGDANSAAPRHNN